MRPAIWLFVCLCVAGCDGDPALDAGRADSSALDAGGGADAGPIDAGARESDAGGADAGGADAGEATCTDGAHNGGESDVDCGGSCPACANGLSCSGAGDCLSARCVELECVSPEGTHPDIIRVDDVAGRNPGGRSWADSYSVDGRCYCESTFDHNISDILVETPVGMRTVRQVCDAIGPGPGSEDRPLYNDIQCGNGPANDAGDEDDCPGRVDIGREGCGHIGPRWDLSAVP